MQLTSFTDYSLRVLIYLARLPQPAQATIAEIAAYHGISRHHLIKVVQTLAAKGFVTSSRGKGGGISLARPAHTIGIGEVVRESEPHMHLAECFNVKDDHCRITRDCLLKGALHEARRAFLTVLDRYTLADVALARQGETRPETVHASIAFPLTRLPDETTIHS